MEETDRLVEPLLMLLGEVLCVNVTESDPEKEGDIEELEVRDEVRRPVPLGLPLPLPLLEPPTSEGLDLGLTVGDTVADMQKVGVPLSKLLPDPDCVLQTVEKTVPLPGKIPLLEKLEVKEAVGVVERVLVTVFEPHPVPEPMGEGLTLELPQLLESTLA